MAHDAVEVPEDLRITYEWRAGSMPPPYHFEYTVIVGPSLRGRVIYLPGYPGGDTPKWTETFDLAPDRLVALYEIIVRKKLTRKGWRTLSNPPVGGSVEWAYIALNNQLYSIPTHPTPTGSKSASALYTFIREVVPQSIWDKLSVQREQYMDAHERRP